ncbi:MAG: T9SS type A sorting domain-containing protein [Chitinophagaceae bacterium]
MMKYSFLSGMTMLAMISSSQVSLTNLNPTIFIDFGLSTISSAGSNPVSAFTGAGFEANPSSAGRLNSNAWAITGWSNGDLSFGGTQITPGTDYTRGSVASSVTTGGIYAFTGFPGSSENPSLMMQPGSSDWSPGTLSLKLKNNGTGSITSLVISYNIYIRNDQGRSNTFNFSYSLDDIVYTPVEALNYTSPEVPDTNGWVLVGIPPSRSTIIPALSIPPGSEFYIRWSGGDFGGAGSRDEFGLDDISVTAIYSGPLPVTFGSFSGFKKDKHNQLQWSTVTELDNRGFSVERSLDGSIFHAIGFVSSLAAGGYSSNLISYNYNDSMPPGFLQYYRLRQEDLGGANRYSPVILIRGEEPSGFKIEGVFPNPACDLVQVLVTAARAEKIRLFITDMSGRDLQREIRILGSGSNNLSANLRGLPAGIYLIRVIGEDGKGGFMRVVKE